MSASSNDSIENIDFGGRFARQFFHNNWPNIEPDLATAVQLHAINTTTSTPVATSTASSHNNNNNNNTSNNTHSDNSFCDSGYESFEHQPPNQQHNNELNNNNDQPQHQNLAPHAPNTKQAPTQLRHQSPLQHNTLHNNQQSTTYSPHKSYTRPANSSTHNTYNNHRKSSISPPSQPPSKAPSSSITTDQSSAQARFAQISAGLGLMKLIMTSDVAARQQRSNSLFTTMPAVTNTLTTSSHDNNNNNIMTNNNLVPYNNSTANAPSNPWSTQDTLQRFNDVDKIERAASLHRSAASYSEPQYTWSGQLPSRSYKNPTFSCKVFLGGVPWDVTEQGLHETFGRFGPLRIQWPGKDVRQQSGHTKAGYVYLIYESERYVKALLQACTQDFGSGSHPEKYYYQLSSRRMRFKEVQVIPWFQADSNYVRNNSGRPDIHRTVFVGALHGMLTAEGLAKIMNDLFGGVSYVGIDTDKFKYPLGSGRVSFNNQRSYMKAVSAAFIEVKSSQFCKKIQVDPYLEPRNCSTCHVQSGIVFCRDCLRYFCKTCWNWHHSAESIVGRQHRPLMRKKRET